MDKMFETNHIVRYMRETAAELLDRANWMEKGNGTRLSGEQNAAINISPIEAAAMESICFDTDRFEAAQPHPVSEFVFGPLGQTGSGLGLYVVTGDPEAINELGRYSAEFNNMKARLDQNEKDFKFKDEAIQLRNRRMSEDAATIARLEQELKHWRGVAEDRDRRLEAQAAKIGELINSPIDSGNDRLRASLDKIAVQRSTNEAPPNTTAFDPDVDLGKLPLTFSDRLEILERKMDVLHAHSDFALRTELDGVTRRMKRG
jgi:hypothetical protein